MNRFYEWLVKLRGTVKILILLWAIGVSGAIVATVGKSAIQTLAGLAVAGSGGQWNNLQDAVVGTTLTSGLAAVVPYGYNGVNFTAINATNGNINVTPVGTKTPSDAYANPTDAVDSFSFLAGWNGATWDRLASGANNADAEAVRTLGLLEVDGYCRTFNGTTWDRCRSAGIGNGTASTGIPANAPYGQFNTTPPTITNGQYGVIQTDANLLPMMGLTGSYSYTHMTTNTTVTAKSGVGWLHTISINTKGAASNTATIYDNTTASAPVIAVIDTTANVGQMIYDVKFSTGLTIVTATGTAADLTISYK